MSTYKVLQDIEAEDKLLGPLSLRQFIYAGIAAVCLYLCYFFITHGAAFLIVFLLPVALLGGFLAFPWGKDQPTEIWALAKVRFMIKPRRRIWSQDGVKELVTITVPKQVHLNYTNGLSETEVRSRLHALADTIDSRGWAVKNANLNLYGRTPLVLADPNSDRLVAPSSLPQAVESVDIQAADDMLDEKNNAGAQRLDSMIAQSAKAHRDQIVEQLQSDAPTPPAQPKNFWFLNQPSASASVPSNMVTFSTQVITPGASTTPTPMPSAPVNEASLVAELDARKQQSANSHLHTIQPLSQQSAPAPLPPVQPTAPSQPADQAAAATPKAPSPPVTPTKQAAILQLASNDDLDVATIAREASRSANDGEVVIKLH